MSFKTFEYQLVRVTSARPAFTIANVYRLPSTPVSSFYNELADFLSTIGSISDRLIVCGDLNCPGPDSSSVDPGLAAVIDEFGLTQHVCSPTRNNNLLHMFASDSSVSVSDVRIDDAGLMSDHRLVAAKVSASVVARRAILTESRCIKDINTAEFERLLRESSVFTAPSSTVNSFADQIEAYVVEALDKVAPLRRRRRRPSKPATRWLSKDAVDAKRQRRRLERVWKRSRNDNDRLAYQLLSSG